MSPFWVPPTLPCQLIVEVLARSRAHVNHPPYEKTGTRYMGQYIDPTRSLRAGTYETGRSHVPVLERQHESANLRPESTYDHVLGVKLGGFGRHLGCLL